MTDNRDPAIRITLLPRDTNSQGTVFGGIILSYIDMAGAIEAHRRTRMPRFVTVAMREVIFHKPVFVGDLVSFYAETVKIGNTSITVSVIVEAERVGVSTEKVRVTEAEVVYVAVDEKRQKTLIRKSKVQSPKSVLANEIIPDNPTNYDLKGTQRLWTLDFGLS
ncbi:MAG TPA: hotdog domain-containing protein [Pyrinomonadaceae bacterium]|nr:hotdog domain-containing protein [Pyrinomonadaceae bacterium]